MAEESTKVAQEESTANTLEVDESLDVAVESTSEAETIASASSTVPESQPEAPEESVTKENSGTTHSEHSASQTTAAETHETEPPKEPDELQPFIDKAFETIHHDVESAELNKFLRAHIQTFREEWDVWPDSAKNAYVHMMASQHVQRKAARTRIMNHEEFKLPVPSAQTTLFESIKQSQIKPKKCIPVLLMPPNLRPTYSLKK